MEIQKICETSHNYWHNSPMFNWVLTRRLSRLVKNSGDYANGFFGMKEKTGEELIQKVAHFENTGVEYYKHEK